MTNSIQLFYLRTPDGHTWYFNDSSRKDLIAQSLKIIQDFMRTGPSRAEFESNSEIQRIFREVPECTLAYQKHIVENIEFESHNAIM
jgi:hypothetical protein